MLWDIDVFKGMDQLRREMNSLFNQREYASTFPLVNVYENRDAIIVDAELSGLSKEQVTVTYSDGVLTISGKRMSNPKVKDMCIVRKERSEGEFEKTIRIPTTVKSDAINATFVNGVLSITLPKAEEAKPKNITIEAK